MVFKIKFQYLFLFCLTQFAVIAQNSTTTNSGFNQQKWETIIKDIDYSADIGDVIDKEEEKRRKKEGEGVTPTETENPFSLGEGNPFLINFLKILVGVFGVALLAILLYNIIGIVPRPANKNIDSNANTVIDLEKIEANIHESDLQKYIQKAVEENDFALAIRLYYLAIIKELSLQKKIKWKRNKTNHDYLQEISKTSYQKQFSEVTRIFERVWYGNRILKKDAFLNIQPVFQQFIQVIQK